MKDAALAVDRSVASAINPLIGEICTEDTLAAVSAVVFELGYMVAETDLAKDHVFRIFETAAAALAWEYANLHPAANNMKEKSHV